MFEDIDFEGLVEPKLRENIHECLRELMDNNMPLGFIMDGTPGASKTTNAGVIARIIQPNFDEEKQIGAGVDAFVDAYNYTADNVKAKYKVAVYDEANDSDRSGALTKIQRILNQLLAASSRQERIVVIIILHRFYRLNETFIENGAVHFLLHLHSKSDGKYVRFHAYDIDSMLWMLYNLRKGKVTKRPKVYSITSPNFGGRLIAPPKDYIEYMDVLSLKGKKALRKKASRDLLASEYYTVTVLANMLGVTKAQVNYQIDCGDFKNSFLRAKSGKIFYYDKELFAVLKRVFSQIEERKLLKDEISSK